MKMKVKDKVESLLKNHPNLRNDDRELIFAFWQTYDNVKFKKPQYPITSPATIIRHRAKIQKDRYKPTDPKVAKKRAAHQRKVLADLGY